MIIVKNRGNKINIIHRPKTYSIHAGGRRGLPGVGVPTGGTTGQVLAKDSDADYDTEWIAPPTAPVTSVNGQTGVVVLDKDDIGLGNVDNTSDANKPVSTAQAAAIDVVQDDLDDHEADTNNPHAVTKTQVGLGNVDNTSDLNKPISTAVQAALDLKANANQKPLPLGSRVIGLGDSIMAGSTPSGQFGSAGPYTDSRPNFNAWFNRLCFGNPKRYYRLRNAGVGGDITGGLAVTETTVTSGSSTSVRYRVLYGNPLFSTTAFYFGALDGLNEAKASVTHTDHGDGSYTVTWATGTTYSWPIGSTMRWGMLGRLQTDVINWEPDMVFVHAGTNDLNNITAAQIADALIDIGTLLRANNIEPIFMELLPRSTYMSNVAQANDAIRYACRNYAGGQFHLIPLYDSFASSTGTFLSGAGWDADGLHPSPTGNVRIANIVDSYMSRLPMRLSQVPLSAYNTDPTNLLQNTNFLAGSAGGGGIVPTGWTLTQFFTTLTTPSLVAPGAFDGIKGQWFKFTCAAGAAGSTTIYQALSTPPAVGDTLFMSCRIRTQDLAGGMVVTIQFLDGFFNNDLVFQLAEDTDGVLVSATARITSTAQNRFSINVVPNGGSGSVMVAEPFVQNMTQLGRNP